MRLKHILVIMNKAHWAINIDYHAPSNITDMCVRVDLMSINTSGGFTEPLIDNSTN